MSNFCGSGTAVAFKGILIVFQSCKFKGNMSLKKASTEGGDEELGGVEEVSKVT